MVLFCSKAGWHRCYSSMWAVCLLRCGAMLFSCFVPFIVLELLLYLEGSVWQCGYLSGKEGAVCFYFVVFSTVCRPSYSEPSLQRLHLFPKTLPLKLICCCREYLMSRLICNKGLLLFLFPHRTYALNIC